jgi:large subunit ribosomal protein LP0
VNEVHLVHKDAKVGASEATLLNMLNISPFTYGMVVQQVYDGGNVFAPSILDIEEDSLLAYFTAAIRNVASVSLAMDYPTLVSVTHSLVNSYKNLLAISVETEYDFEGSEKVIVPLFVFPRMISTAFFLTFSS